MNMASSSVGQRVENVAIRAIVDDVLAEDESHKAKRKRENDPDAKPKKSVRFNDVDDVHEFVVDDDEKVVRLSHNSMYASDASARVTRTSRTI
jgi:hypothetical protein